MLRSELVDMIALTERLLAAGEPALLSTLFSTNGSTYRPLGSMMVSGPGSGFVAGGISGGCLEEYIARRGREIIERQPAAILHFDADPDAERDDVPTLGCGGSIEVLVERMTPSHLTFLREFTTAHLADSASTAACIVEGDASTLTIQRRLNPATGREGECIEEAALSSARRSAFAKERSCEANLDGERRVMIHYVPPITRLVVFGAGNDVRPVATIAHSLGWHVAIADRRARLATRSRFPEADQVVAGDWWKSLQEIKITPRTAVVVMTHSFPDDVEILPLLADKPMAYVGVLGPAHRRLRLLEELEQSNLLDMAFAERVRGPIGLDLGDRSPQGIAVSIVSEILAEIHHRLPASLASTLP